MANKVENLRYRVTPMLPTVYSNALSYLEVVSRVAQKLNEVIEYLNTYSDEVLEEAKNYTDNAVSEFTQTVNQLRTDMLRYQADINTTITAFKQVVNGNLESFDAENEKFRTEINTQVAAINDNLDAKIELNNAKLIKEISENLGDTFQVLDPFTGDLVSVQDMVYRLADLHLTDAATVDYVKNKEKTVTQIIAYDKTCTEWVNSGKTILG